MRELTEQAIRASFVNCSKGEAKRLMVPRDLAERPWGDLDFLGWRDPGAPTRSYLVAERGDGIIGVTFRLALGSGGQFHRSMCSLCLTTHPASGVALMTAGKARQAGKEGDSIGEYICTNMACSLYIRGKKLAEPGGRFQESLTVHEQVQRARQKLSAFLDKLFV
ncbi:FBP domain-containing protein [Streptomyces sp. DT24]|uniref:FBP domain-containing protein n=1 Tax=unclassified Streptomyces TaxID=2593676 RepID=UPI003CF0E059